MRRRVRTDHKSVLLLRVCVHVGQGGGGGRLHGGLEVAPPGAALRLRLAPQHLGAQVLRATKPAQGHTHVGATKPLICDTRTALRSVLVRTFATSLELPSVDFWWTTNACLFCQGRQVIERCVEHQSEHWVDKPTSDNLTPAEHLC